MAERRKVGSIFVDMILGQVQFDKDVYNVQKKMQKLGKDLTRIGATLTASVTAPLTGLGVLAVKASMNFESAFAGVKKTVSATGPQFDALKGKLIDLSMQLPSSSEELAKFAQIGGQLNIPVDQLEGFAETVAKVALSFDDVDADAAALSMAQIANATKTPIGEMSNLASAIATVADTTAASEGPIMDMAQRLQGIAGPAKMTAADIVGIAGGLADLGIEAEMGGGAIQRLVVQMLKAAETGEDVNKWAAVMGVSTKQFADIMKNDAAGGIATFIERLGWVQQQGGSVVDVLDKMGISETRMTQALLSAAGAGDRFRNSLETSRKAYEDNSRLTSETAARMQTFESALKVMKNAWSEAFRLIGDDIISVLRPLVGVLTDVAKWITQLDPDTRKAALAFAAVAAAIGPILTVGGLLLTTFASPMLLWAGAITVALAGAAAAWVMWGDDLKKVFDNTIRGFNILVTDFEGSFNKIVLALDAMAAQAVEALGRMITEMGQWVTGKFKGLVVDPLMNSINMMKEGFGGLYDAVVGHSFIPDMVSEIGTEMQKLDAKMVKPSKGATDEVKRMMEALAGSATTSNKKLTEGLSKSTEAIARLAQTSTPLAELRKQLETILKSGKSGEELAAALTKARKAYEGTKDEVKAFDKELKAAEESVTDQAEKLKEMGKAIDDLLGVDRFPEITKQVEEAFGKRSQMSAEAFADKLKEMSATLGDTADKADAMAAAIEKMNEQGQSEGFWKHLTTPDPNDIKDFAANLGDAAASAIGSALQDVLSGGDIKNAFKNLGGTLGEAGGAALGAAIGGPLGEAIGGALGEAIGTKITDDITQIGQSTKDTIGGIATFIDTIFPGVGSAMGAVANAIVGGSKDDQTKAREQIQDWIESQMGGNLEGGFEFDKPGWAEEWWTEMGANSVTAFTSLGEGLTAILGVTEDVGTQIGYILSQNLGGNLDEARILMGQLGISAEQLEQAIIKQGLAAGKTWQEIEIMLQGIVGLSGEGLAAFNDIEGAFGRLIVSGGKGADAISNLRNLAIEAMESGATTLQELEAQLRASGKFTDAEITALMTSLGQRGITSLEQLKDASVRILGGVIADMLTQLGENFGKSTDQVQELIDRIESIPTNITTIHSLITEEKKAGGNSSSSSAEKNKGGATFPLAKGGIFDSIQPISINGGSNGVMAEAGKEAALPLTRVNGKLGVSATGFGSPSISQDLHLHIDARGAQMGAEQAIRDMFDQVVDRATTKTLRVLYESARR